MALQFTGVKVFSSTLVADRLRLGEVVSTWLAKYPDYIITDMLVRQSSDAAFHCLTITVFYRA